jgi:hypothetical protein
LVIALKSVLLPTLGKPITPSFIRFVSFHEKAESPACAYSARRKIRLYYTINTEFLQYPENQFQVLIHCKCFYENRLRCGNSA